MRNLGIWNWYNCSKVDFLSKYKTPGFTAHEVENVTCTPTQNRVCNCEPGFYKSDGFCKDCKSCQKCTECKYH